MARRFDHPPTLDEIEAIARSALDSLPEPFASKLRHVVLQVQDFADDELLTELGIEHPLDLTGVYEGIPIAERSVETSGTMPDRIRLFRRAILDEWVEDGEALLVTGPNGCGKSSLIRLVAGLLHASAGTLDRADAALANDDLALDRELALGRALAFWKGPQLAEAMAAFGLDTLAPVPVRLLSTGQARRARLARVMASGAPLWLLDEPLNGLDSDGRDRLEAAISGHRAAGGGVLAASHQPLGGEWRVMELGR